MPAYADVLRRAAAAADVLGGAATTAGDFEGYPLLRLEFGSGATPLLIDAGLHGEEPAAVLGLLAWLETRATRWRALLRVTVLPCLNPHGFERGLRRSRDTEDLNRHFDEPEFPLTRIVTGALAGRRFPLAMDLHEDCDFSAFYLYELKAAPPFLGERLLGAVAPSVPLSHDEVVGEFRTDRGLIRAADPAARLRGRTGWPLAFALFQRTAPHTITVETPGRLPLPRRAALQAECLDEACRYLTAPPVAGPGTEGGQ